MSFIAGLVGGILGGMGMGGGTLLVPILTVFLSMAQKTSQFMNLVAFIPMSVVCLFLHFKNKLVDFKKVLFILIPAVIMAIASSFLAVKADGDFLQKGFGIFLILLAVLGVAGEIIKKRAKK
ncbi:putative permease [Acidaminococcus sp. CAG:917]|nr:putative permease [Acidaminococcus sp. CAG:917]